MVTYERHAQIRRPVEEVFDFVGTRYFENHPRWEREVIEVRRLTAGPIGVGSRGIMVRHEYGRTSESPLEVTAFDPPRKIAFRHVGGPMVFEIAFGTAPVGPSSTDLGVRVQAELRGRYKLLTPMLAFNLPRTGGKIMRRLVELIEAERSHARVEEAERRTARA